jgi:hypothetical protein
MSEATQSIRDCVIRESAAELRSAHERIVHCLGQLGESQVWHRSAPGMNSIGNLVLHLCGNVGQWIVSGLGGMPDHRHRPSEFAEQGPIPLSTLLEKLSVAVDAAAAAMEGVSAEALVAPLRIQGFETTGFGALVHSVSHFRGHTQEIIRLTRDALGDAYRFAWVPQTKEQGAS